MTITVRTTRPAYWEAVGRQILAASALVLGGATAWFNLGPGSILSGLAVLVLGVVAWAVAWPEKASQLLYTAAHIHALAAAGVVLAGTFLAFTLNGSLLLFLMWVAAIGAVFLVLSPSLLLGPEDRR